VLDLIQHGDILLWLYVTIGGSRRRALSCLAGVAQLVEQLIRNQQVRGSSPRAGSKILTKCRLFAFISSAGLACWQPIDDVRGRWRRSFRSGVGLSLVSTSVPRFERVKHLSIELRALANPAETSTPSGHGWAGADDRQLHTGSNLLQHTDLDESTLILRLA
jgi:hypothetical protein